MIHEEVNGFHSYTGLVITTVHINKPLFPFHWNIGTWFYAHTVYIHMREKKKSMIYIGRT